MLQIIKADFFCFVFKMSPKQNAYDHLVVVFVLINGYFNLFCKRAYITRTVSEQSKKINSGTRAGEV